MLALMVAQLLNPDVDVAQVAFDISLRAGSIDMRLWDNRATHQLKHTKCGQLVPEANPHSPAGPGA